MKLSTSLSVLVAILPLLSQVCALPAPEYGLVARQGGRNRGGGDGGNQNDGAANGGGDAGGDAADAGGAEDNAGAGDNANDGAAGDADNDGDAAAGDAGNDGDGDAAAGNDGDAAAGNDGDDGDAAAGDAANDGGDPQESLTLDPKVIAKGFANDGQDVPTEGQVASLTSTNNFINFCLTVDLPITDGKQIKDGSCNPAPIGAIPSTGNMPSSKFTNPKNGDTIAAEEQFTISMAIKNLETGNFVNAQENYFAAPQQLNGQGTIIGHSHVVVEKLDSLDQTTATDPNKFAFFKGLNAAAQGGVLTADVDKGLPVGDYRLCSINSAANHQPVIVPIAQHGSLDDCVYFSATADGEAAAGADAGDGGAADDAAADDAAADDEDGAAAGNGNGGAADGEDGAAADGEDGAAADGEDGAAADGEDGAAADGEDGAADGNDGAAADGNDGAAADGNDGAADAAGDAAAGDAAAGDAAAGGDNDGGRNGGGRNGGGRNNRKRFAREK